MTIPRGHRFASEFDSAFPQGLVLIGEVVPDNEHQTREDKATGRPVRQKLDQVTGTRQWKATVTDPDEPTAKRASFEITFIAEVQPVPTTLEVLPGMRPIELDGLTAEPRLAGTGEFKYQSSLYRATGSTATASGGGYAAWSCRSAGVWVNRWYQWWESFAVAAATAARAPARRP